MKLKVFEVGVLGANCYLLEKNNNCILIDMGGDFDRVYAHILQNNYNLLGVIFTHGHFDHIAGGLTAQRYTQVYIYEKEAEFLNASRLNLSRELGLNQTETFDSPVLLKAGDQKIGDFSFKIIPTPGHTAGSVCILIENMLFSGDTIFAGSYGRYDFPTGSFDQLENSIVSLLDGLANDVIIYPGHGESTTIKREREINPLYLYAKH